jgi:hypothetical protein
MVGTIMAMVIIMVITIITVITPVILNHTGEAITQITTGITYDVVIIVADIHGMTITGLLLTVPTAHIQLLTEEPATAIQAEAETAFHLQVIQAL